MRHLSLDYGLKQGMLLRPPTNKTMSTSSLADRNIAVTRPMVRIIILKSFYDYVQSTVVIQKITSETN